MGLNRIFSRTSRQLGTISPLDDDCRTFLDESLRCGQADPAAAASHDGGLVFQQVPRRALMRRILTNHLRVVRLGQAGCSPAWPTACAG